jgi:hypothetical protein
MTLFFALAAYALAMTAANLILAGAVGAWGRESIAIVSPLNAFFLIGLDLAMRDWLQVQLSRTCMLLLIAGTGLLTYFLNPGAGHIAVASAVAFTGAALVDWSIFTRLRARPWIFRSNASNAGGALVDSLIFPALTFGALMPQVVVLQFLAKTAGGAIWSWLIARRLGGVR